jgi:hypothetical protein
MKFTKKQIARHFASMRGKARTKKLSKKRRSEIAAMGAAARHKKTKV